MLLHSVWLVNQIFTHKEQDSCDFTKIESERCLEHLTHCKHNINLILYWNATDTATCVAGLPLCLLYSACRELLVACNFLASHQTILPYLWQMSSNSPKIFTNHEPSFKKLKYSIYYFWQSIKAIDFPVEKTCLSLFGQGYLAHRFKWAFKCLAGRDLCLKNWKTVAMRPKDNYSTCRKGKKRMLTNLIHHFPVSHFPIYVTLLTCTILLLTFAYHFTVCCHLLSSLPALICLPLFNYSKFFLSLL